jgi:ketosteroid isomerase-like protein
MSRQPICNLPLLGDRLARKVTRPATERPAPCRRGILSGKLSEENVEAFRRAIEAANRQDVDAFLANCDPEVEWPRPAILMSLGGEAKVYRGHEGVREVLDDVFEVFAELQLELSEIRDLGDRIVAIGQLRPRGAESGAETVAELGYVVDFKNRKAVRMQTYLDPKEALEAAGLSE